MVTLRTIRFRIKKKSTLYQQSAFVRFVLISEPAMIILLYSIICLVLWWSRRVVIAGFKLKLITVRLTFLTHSVVLHETTFRGTNVV